MEISQLGIQDAYEFVPSVYKDERGHFSTPFQAEPFTTAVGKQLFPVRDISHNLSARGVLRGFHYTSVPPGRAKYVYCPKGAVQDYLLDLRIGSPTFGQWSTTDLSQDNCRALYIPMGVGHAFIATEADTVIVYVMSEGYAPEAEQSVSPLDPTLGLSLPEGLTPVQSERDAMAPTLSEAEQRGLLPRYEACKKAEATLWP